MNDRVQLAKTLIQLSNTKGVKIAEAAGIKNPNFYNWMANKPKALSENAVEKLFSVLGVTNGQLNANTLHRWYESDHDAENINQTLTQLINLQEYQNTEIFHVRSIDNKLFNLLKLSNDKHSILILCFNTLPRTNEYPINAKKIGFGKDIFLSSPIPSEIYAKWMHVTLNLEIQSFIHDASIYLPDLNLPKLNTLTSFQSINTAGDFKEVSEEINILKATNEGFKAIIRELLKELRIHSPDNKFHIDSERKAIFEAIYNHELEKLSPQNPINY